MKTSDVVMHMYVDGAARNNPGPAGAGVALFQQGKLVGQVGAYVGSKTNNQAEYLALILGLFVTRDYRKQGNIAIFADSQLLVRQMRGEYKVRDEQLKILQKAAYHLLGTSDYSIQHVPRHENEHADTMANEAIDKKMALPPTLRVWLHEQGFSL